MQATPAHAATVSPIPLVNGLTATLSVGDHPRRMHGIRGIVRGLDHHGCLLEMTQPLADTRFGWLTMELPGTGLVRPLVEMLHEDEEGTTVRFIHVFPDDRETLSGFEPLRF